VRDDAYTRIALRLREIGTEDREWLLGHLGDDDCQRVSAALQEYRARNIPQTGPQTGTRTVAPPEAPRAQVEGSMHPTARLAAASASEAKKLLAGQPDWAIALVLSAGPWTWAQELLGQWSPERIRALRALAGELGHRVKPQLRDAVIRIIALKLAPIEQETPVTQAFDVALQRAAHELSAIDSLKLDLP
jgi:hypothetical protein